MPAGPKHYQPLEELLIQAPYWEVRTRLGCDCLPKLTSHLSDFYCILIFFHLIANSNATHSILSNHVFPLFFFYLKKFFIPFSRAGKLIAAVCSQGSGSWHWLLHLMIVAGRDCHFCPEERQTSGDQLLWRSHRPTNHKWEFVFSTSQKEKQQQTPINSLHYDKPKETKTTEMFKQRDKWRKTSLKY